MAEAGKPGLLPAIMSPRGPWIQIRLCLTLGSIWFDQTRIIVLTLPPQALTGQATIFFGGWPAVIAPPEEFKDVLALGVKDPVVKSRLLNGIGRAGITIERYKT